MEELINKSNIVKGKENYVLQIDSNKVLSLVDDINNTIHIGNYNKYLQPVNDILFNKIILRILVEVFINKIKLKDNQPYIIISSINDIKYRFSITKLVDDEKEQYMYGLMMY